MRLLRLSWSPLQKRRWYAEDLMPVLPGVPAWAGQVVGYGYTKDGAKKDLERAKVKYSAPTSPSRQPGE
jgi:hypothetical protein